ncbi:type II toxin-antitoxin system VapC family toxin [Acidocella facilis]|uniref:type II toxin-antitoxin system VapC family toxin n=1 Tax=Acidocella facilis TaxID=525 RepID=UPI001F1CF5E2|nr:type II toxin-antitoxin system VapC family toxin [Acidocella facilis]
MPVVVDASVGLKWVLEEPDSPLAEALLSSEADLLVPDFWLNEATNVLWLQVRKKIFAPDEAREALALLRAVIHPTPTGDLALHDVALDIGIEVNHSTYDTLYLAFAVAMGASAVVVSDAAFLRAMQSHPDPNLSTMVVSLATWVTSQGKKQHRDNGRRRRATLRPSPG